MTRTIAICVRFDSKNPASPFRDPDMIYLLDGLQSSLSGLRVVGVDWRTATSAGVIQAFQPQNGSFLLDLQEIDLMHLLHVGYGSSRDLTLRNKWLELGHRIDIIQRHGVRLINPSATIKYGRDKTYLLDLAQMGLPVIETCKVSSHLKLNQVLERFSSRFQVVKPSNGECGKYVSLLDELTPEILARMQLESDDLLLQPFVADVHAGEKSMTFFRQRLFHAVRKVPSIADFRSNGNHTGATIYSYVPNSAELTLGARVFSSYPYPLDIFRLDVIGEGETLKIMELEVVDPNYYHAVDARYVSALSEFYQEVLCDTYAPGQKVITTS